jgi:hypothetical protein
MFGLNWKLKSIWKLNVSHIYCPEVTSLMSNISPKNIFLLGSWFCILLKIISSKYYFTILWFLIAQINAKHRFQVIFASNRSNVLNLFYKSWHSSNITFGTQSNYTTKSIFFNIRSLIYSKELCTYASISIFSKAYIIFWKLSKNTALAIAMLKSIFLC